MDQTARDLQRIDEALGRLESGRFGYCEECGGRIELPRLTEDPAASCCEACAQAVTE